MESVRLKIDLSTPRSRMLDPVTYTGVLPTVAFVNVHTGWLRRIAHHLHRQVVHPPDTGEPVAQIGAIDVQR